MHRLKVKPSLLIVDYGGMSISAARGRVRAEMTSPFDSTGFREAHIGIVERVITYIHIVFVLYVILIGHVLAIR
jgi:hypothetical protein